jgi:hypothetical protein
MSNSLKKQLKRAKKVKKIGNTVRNNKPNHDDLYDILYSLGDRRANRTPKSDTPKTSGTPVVRFKCLNMDSINYTCSYKQD